MALDIATLSDEVPNDDEPTFRRSQIQYSPYTDQRLRFQFAVNEAGQSVPQPRRFSSSISNIQGIEPPSVASSQIHGIQPGFHHYFNEGQ